MLTYKRRASQRRRVAQEAAELLYVGQEKEFKQAKLQAAETLGIHVLPSNAEIAAEMDRLAEEREGKTRQERLARMRHSALQIMQALKLFKPILVGSVWRGTAHHNSDIDIVIYADDSQPIISTLQEKEYMIIKTGVRTVTKNGEKKHSFHIYVQLSSDGQVEFSIRNLNDINLQTKCEIYGDNVTGLTIQQLQQVLRNNPQKKFVPT